MKKKGLIISLGGTLALLASFPSLCSTSLGKNLTVSALQKLYSASLNIEDLSLGWFGSQTIVGFSYNSQKMDVSCQKITLEEGLFSFFLHPKTFSSLELIEPTIRLASSARDLQITPTKQASFFPNVAEAYFTSYQELLPFEGDIHIVGGSLQVEDVIFSPIEINASLKGRKMPSSVHVAADTKQGQEAGSLRIDALLSEEPSVNATANRFPLSAIDRLLPYPGMLLDLIGPTLDMKCLVSGKDALWKGDLLIHSDLVSASLQLQVVQNALQLGSPANLQITLTPKGVKHLDEKITLLNPVVFSLDIATLSIPTQENQILFPKAAFSSRFSVAPYTITPQMQASLQGTVATQDLETVLDCNCQGQVITNGLSSSAEFSANIKNLFSQKPGLEASLQTEKIPTKAIEPFIQPSLTSYLGDSVQVFCKILGTKEKAALTLRVNTPLLNVKDVELAFDNQHLILTSPASISYQIKHPLLQNTPTIAATFTSGSWTKEDLSLEATMNLSSVILTELMQKKGYEVPASIIKLQMASLTDIRFSLENPLCSLSSTLGLTPKFLSIKDPTIFEYRLSQESLPIYLPSGITFTDAVVRLTCKPVKISLDDIKNTPPINLALELGSTQIQSSKTALSLPIEHLHAAATISLEKQTLNASYELELASAPIVGSIDLRSFSNPEFKSYLSAKKLPVSLLQSLTQGIFPSDKDYSSLLGDELSLTAEVEKGNKAKSLSVDVTSPLLKLKGGFDLQNQMLTSLSPLSLEYTLTPKGYKRHISSPFSLQKDVQIVGAIQDLCLPLDFSLDKARGTLTTSASSIILESKEIAEPLVISDLKASLSKKTEKKGLEITAGFKSKEGALQLSGLLSQIKPLQGSLQMNMAEFPSTALDFFSLNKNSFYPLLLGPFFTANCNLSLEQGKGPLSIGLQSKKAHFDMQAEILPSAITLRKDLSADLLVTPELAKLFIKTDSPISSLSAPKPITVWASKQGFSIPLDKNLSAVEIPNIQINLNKIYCKNEGAIASALQQLKSKEPNNKEIEIWFAPFDLHVRKGVVEIERTEFLLDRTYDLALWGEVSLPKNYAELTLGITADAMRAAFGLKQLPKDYVLKIPVKGPLDNVQIKTKTAASKITALLLWQSDLLSKAAGPFGGVLKQVIPPPGGEGKTPPAKRPFPWESDNPSPVRKKKNK